MSCSFLRTLQHHRDTKLPALYPRSRYCKDVFHLNSSLPVQSALSQASQECAAVAKHIPAGLLGKLMAQTQTKKELVSIFAPAILSLLFAITTYISYTYNPECSQSVNAGQCWDFRPLLSHAFSFLTLILTIFSLILTFFSVHRYRLRKGSATIVMYESLVRALTLAYQRGREEGIEDQAFSKALTDIIIANHLGHQLDPGGKGADGVSGDEKYEYKATAKGFQANFNIGRNLGSHEENIRNIEEKFADIDGVYFARLNWGRITHVAYCSIQNLLPILREKLRKIGLENDWVHPQVSWNEFIKIDGAEVDIQSSGNDTYPQTVAALLNAYQIAKDMGLDIGIFSKGAQNDVFLAQREGHLVLQGGGGPDAVCRRNNNDKFEYKISCVGKGGAYSRKKWMFNHGARKSTEENQRLIREKYQDITAAYLVTRNYHELVVIIRIPKDDLIRLLLKMEERTNMSPMNLELLVGDLRDFVIFPNPNYQFGTNKAHLKNILTQRRLDTDGTRTQLINRLIENDQENARATD